MSTIFLSYRRQDSADVTGRIYDYLHKYLEGDQIFKDVDSIPYGADFRRTIDDALSQSDVFLAVVGPKWTSLENDSGNVRIHDPEDYVRVELETAFALGICVIPLLVSGATMPTAKELPESLRQFTYCNAAPIRSDPDFSNDIQRLLAAIRSARDSKSPLRVASDRTRIDSAKKSLRYYLYVSDSKVNMLFAQIPHSIKSKMLLGKGIETVDGGAEADRIHKLEVVEQFIRERFHIGSIDKVDEYIAGTHTLAWGFTHGSMESAVDDNPFVFFTGQHEDTTLLMSGSSRHLIGDQKAEHHGMSSSSIPHVIEILVKDIDRHGMRTIDVGGHIASHEKNRFPYSGDKLALAIVEEAKWHLSSSEQRLEFLAKTLLHGPSPSWPGLKCVLASPLYVALDM